MNVPKSFRVPDYVAEALHDITIREGLEHDGDLLRRIVFKFLEDENVNLSDYMFKSKNKNNR